MKTSRLGCISGTGILITLISLLLMGGIAFARGGVLFNPGGLNDQKGAVPINSLYSHAETGGRCSACHTAFWETEKMADRCLACHQELNTSGENFHLVMLAQSETYQCFGCHTDHRGAQAPLTIMDLQKFPHQATGYSLEGHRGLAVGADFTCQDCHGEQIDAVDTGICTKCHSDSDPLFIADHLSAFGSDCLPCHDGIDSYGKIWDHAQTAFPLQGKHAEAGCTGCHKGARTIPEMKNTPQGCYTCHASDDAHDGQFGQDCSECHNSDGWEGAAFDHSLAAFPLTGAHTNVACEACHQNRLFRGTPQDCYACHAVDDPHAGQFGQDCAQCHTPDRWADVTFDHSLAAFQLSGAHASVACSECHKDGVFKGAPQECSACHTEPEYHLGLFGVDCAACHTSEAWTPAIFDRPHTFPFNHGESGMSSCQTCHPNSLAAYTCYECHEHNPAEIEREHREEGIGDFQDCARCHPTGLKEEGEGREGGDD